MNIDIIDDTKLEELQLLVNSSSNVLIFCHTNADGDALGSTLAWAEYLRQQGKTATVVAPDKYPEFLSWLPGQQGIIQYDKNQEKVQDLLNGADLECFMDLNDISRVGDDLSRHLTEGYSGKRLIIDHHLNPTIPADVCISLPLLSSTSEIVFRLIWQLGGYEAMTNEMAQCIYCGMMTDTGSFSYNSTQPEIFYIVAQLLKKGIDKDKIYRNVYHVFSIDRLRLYGYIIYQKLNVLTPLRASYYTISKEDQKRFHFKKGDAEGLVNFPLQIKGHRLSISLREDTEKPSLIWVSLRSIDDFPCNEMAAQFFNGGGHKNAAGGRLYCSLLEAEIITRNAIKAYKEKL